MLDMEKMKEKYRSLKEGAVKQNDPLNWKPENGDQDIRIICPEDGDPFKEVWVHYRIGEEAPFLCPKKNFGDSCPVCDFAWQLYDEGDTKSAKELLPSARYLSPVVVRGDEEDVKIWNYSKTVYRELIGYVMNEEYGDITDPESGIDFTLTYDLEAAKNRQLATRLVAKRRSSALSDDKKTVKRLLGNIPDISKKYPKKTQEEVGKILESFLGSEKEQTEKYGGGPEQESDVDKAFRDLGL